MIDHIVSNNNIVGISDMDYKLKQNITDKEYFKDHI